MGLIALVAFWAMVVRVWIVDGPKIPLFFSALWVGSFFGVGFLAPENPFIFIAIEALLTVVLIIVDRAKSIAI